MSTTALLLIIVSAFLHAGWNFFGKRMFPTEEVYLIALTAGMIALLPVVVVYFDFLPEVPGHVWVLVGAAGFFQALYFSGLGAAYRSGDLSIAYPAARSLPVLIVFVVSLLLGRGDEISRQAIAGFFIVVVSAFFLPMRRWGDFRLRNYVNRTGACALLAAVGTAGYSILDDRALRVMRSSEALRTGMSITEISFLYLAFEAFTTVLWLVIVFGATRGVRGTWRETRILQPVVMGVMIYVTYGIVLVSMAFAADVSYIVAFRQVSLPIGVVLGLVLLKERGGWLRLGSTVVMVAGLMLVATG